MWATRKRALKTERRRLLAIEEPADESDRKEQGVEAEDPQTNLRC